MTRLAVLALLASMIAVPALAQVINGETPLDETPLHRETPGPAEQPRPQPPAAASTTAAPEPSESPAARRD